MVLHHTVNQVELPKEGNTGGLVGQITVSERFSRECKRGETQLTRTCDGILKNFANLAMLLAWNDIRAISSSIVTFSMDEALTSGVDVSRSSTLRHPFSLTSLLCWASCSLV